MKRAEEIEKELKAIFKDKISDDDLMNFAWGLETIKKSIRDNPKLQELRADFEMIKKVLIEDYWKWIRGEKECIIGNVIVKATRILPSSGTIHGTIPMVQDQLRNEIVLSIFRRPKSKAKELSWEQFKIEVGKCEKTIRKEFMKIPDDKLKGKITFRRDRGRKSMDEPGLISGKEIESVSKELLKYFKK
jgi:hypothetical protein